MRTFKKDGRIERTKDQFIADALLQSGFKEVKEELKEEVKESKKKAKIED